MKHLFAFSGSALLLVALTANAASGICKNSQFYVGAGTHLGQNKLDYARAQLFFEYTKVNSFRDEFYWHRLERERGVLKIPENLTDLDKVVRIHAVSNGPRPLIPLNYNNKYYDKGDLPRSAEALEAYAKYTEFVARTYSASIPIFEIWNEWNAGFGSSIVPRKKGSPEDYVRLMQVAVPPVRKASPQSLILGGATANVDEKWSLSFVELGGLKLADGFSIHPYNYKHHAKRTAEDAVEGLHVLQEKMSRAAGVAGVPFYLTEIGMPSSTGKNGYPEEEVAVYAARFLLLIRTRPYVCGVWWYELFDSGSRDDEEEHRFGLFRPDGSAKPVAEVLAQIANFLKEGRDFTEQRTGNVQSVAWSMPDRSKYVAYWSLKGRETISFEASRHTKVSLPFDNDSAEPTNQPGSSGKIVIGTRPRIFGRLKQ